MASNIFATIKKVWFAALLLATYVLCIEGSSHQQMKETQMSMYFHDFAAGPNATLAQVAGIPGKKWGFLEFGTVFVTDDPVTAGIEINSPQIARAQGIYVASSLDGGSTHGTFSIAFTNKEYNGSTLELQGRSILFQKVREVSVVSGTGKFRFARGYATFETVYHEPSTLYTVLRCNITIMHY